MQSQKKLRAPFLITFFALAALLIMSSCGNAGTTGTPTSAKAPDKQQVFRNPVAGGDINTFDPAQATDLSSIAAIDMVFTGMVSLNDQLQVSPQLAKDWSSSPNGLTWTFNLKHNLKFSDGSALTSADVAYSIDRALSPAIYNADGISLTYLGLIKGAADRTAGTIPSVIGTGVQTPDANTVVINITTRSAYFLQALSYSTSYVVEKSVVTKWGDTKWTDHLSENGGQGGDGPFKVLSYDHNTGIVFVPNTSYEGKQPQLKKVINTFIKDTNTNFLEYQANQADMSSVPTAEIKQAQALPNHQFHKAGLLAINYYGLNYLVKPFDNIKIRQAMALALNKDIIVQSIWGNRYIPSNHIIPKGMLGYNEGLTGPDGVAKTSGDPTKAKQLFAEGMQEEGLTLATFPTIKFTYSNASQDTEKEVITAIQMWQTVLGITSIKTDPTSKIFSEINNTTGNTSLQMWKIDWYADYPDAQDWITLQFDKGQSSNNSNYGQNTSADASDQQALQPQMETADGTLDQVARMKLYNQIEQKLINDVAWLPIDQVANTYVLKPYVIGVIDNAQNLTPPDDWGNIYIAVH